MSAEGEAERGGLPVSKDVQAAAGVCKVTTISVRWGGSQLLWSPPLDVFMHRISCRVLLGTQSVECPQCPDKASLAGSWDPRAVWVQPFPCGDREARGPREGSYISPTGAMLRGAMSRPHPHSEIPDLKIHQCAMPACECLRHETPTCKGYSLHCLSQPWSPVRLQV